MSRAQTIEKKNYFYIIDGSWRQKVDEGVMGAVRRDWETPDGRKGTKYELHFANFIGYIENVQFFDGDYGKQISITLDENENGEKPLLQISASSREGSDFLRKLPAIDFTREVKLSPYSFTDEGDEKRGLTVYQQDEDDNFKVKLGDYFYDFETKESRNGMPSTPKPKDEMTKNAWKAYFLTVDDFLVDYTIENIVSKIETAKLDRKTKTPKSKEQEERMRSAEETAEGINIDDIPFD